MPPAIQNVDERAYAWVARQRSPQLDRLLPRLSRAANHSRLWIGLAAALALIGGRKGRSGATRGIAAIGATSAFVNGPLKLLSRRHRPESSSIPVIRQLSRLPLSSSFPSGHAASAAAFATAASLELPAAALPLGVLAAGVGVSRVYTGVHYPSDVAVGAAIGVGAAVLTKRVADARNTHERPSISVSELGSVDVGDGRGLVVALNLHAGAGQEGLMDAVARGFPTATVVTGNGSLADKVRARCGPETAAIVAVGGDGTINDVSTVALERGIPLGIVPAGTLNHLARDLGIDDVDAGIEAIKRGRLGQMEVGMIAERPFLNTASFGAYPEFVDMRETFEDRLGKWPAAVIALLEMTRRNAPVSVEIDGRPMSIWAIFIGNCCYAPSGFVPMHRKALDDGLLDVRVLRADSSHPRLRPLLTQGPSRIRERSALEVWTTDRVDVRSHDGPLRLAHDGDTFDGPERFVAEKSPKQLGVFVPASGR